MSENFTVYFLWRGEVYFLVFQGTERVASLCATSDPQRIVRIKPGTISQEQCQTLLNWWNIMLNNGRANIPQGFELIVPDRAVQHQFEVEVASGPNASQKQKRNEKTPHVTLKQTALDLFRHSEMHSWYKQLNIEGSEFYAVLVYVKARRGYHWHIFRSCGEPREFTFRLNCFWRGLEENGYMRGTKKRLFGDTDHEDYVEFVAENYPGATTSEVWEKEHNGQGQEALKVLQQQIQAQCFENPVIE